MLHREELFLRNPKATNLAQAIAFNHYTVGAFFTNLRKIHLRLKFQPQNIYNVDKTGFTTVQKPVKVIAGKEDKQVGR